MSTPVGNLVKTKVTSVIESFGNGAEAKLVDSFNTISLSENELSENNKTLTIAIDDGLRYFDKNGDSLPSSFSITYTDGMTWGEWVNSEYNNIQFTLEFSEGIDDETLMEYIKSRKFELVENKNAIRLKITTFTGPALDVVYNEGFEAYLEIFDTYEVVNLTDEIDSTKDYVVASY